VRVERSLRRKSGYVGGRENAGNLVPASSYHLPEGRYFEMPLILKQHKKSRLLPLSLMLGVTLSLIPSWESEKITLDLGGEHVSVLARKDNLTLLTGNRLIVQARAATDLSIRGKKTSSYIPAKQVEGKNVAKGMMAHSLSSNEIKNALSANNRLRMTGLAATQRPMTRKYQVPDERIEVAVALPAKSASETALTLAEVQADLARSSLRMRPQEAEVALAQPIPEAQPITLAQMQADLARSNRKLEILPTADEQPTVLAFHLPESGPMPPQKQRRSLSVPESLKHLVTNESPDILALGYAPLNTKESPFDSLLSANEGKTYGRFIPPIGQKDHAWAANPLPAQAFTSKEQKCLAEAVYFEARGESVKGQAAVAQVVLNRVRNPAYPSSICGVVYQNVKWRGRCQFSFACDGKKRKVNQPIQWRLAQDVAMAVTAGQIWLPEVGSSTHYHATYVRPRWARSMIKLEKIGLHIFYRTKYGGWS